MKILVVAHFDPCGVALGHRDLMRQAGHDYRVALDTAVTPRHLDADWLRQKVIGWTKIDGAWREQLALGHGDLGGLRAFAYDADVIQFCPGIGPRAASDVCGLAVGDDPPAASICNLDWSAILADRASVGRSQPVVYFHGSKSTWAYLVDYRNFYRPPQYTLAASTLDYVTELDATYLPPYIRVDLDRAALRTDDDPFTIAHTPTDPANCQTAEFGAIAREAGAIVLYATQRPHAEILKLKQQAHACFDHLRGAFSVNTLEATALGLVPLVGMNPRYAARGRDLGTDPPPASVESIQDLRTQIRALINDVALTAHLQEEAHDWFVAHFAASKILERLERFYTGLT